MKKKKIGILTYHRPINYGAILQTFALQETIKKFDVEVEIIDYRNTAIESKHKKTKFKHIKNIRDLKVFVLNTGGYNKKYDNFRQFSTKYLSLSKTYNNIAELKNDDKLYDMYIVGSDQVWNMNINKGDYTYLLNFTSNKKKNSYAASFGYSEVPHEYKNSIKEIATFKNISVREKQAQQILNLEIDNSVEVVLDPTFLLNKDEWESIVTDVNINNKYILVYAFSGSKYIKKIAKTISKKKGFDIVWISTQNVGIGKNIINKSSCAPDEFLGLFKNAQYVITNSFHGTVFSIIFKKNFYTELLDGKVGTNSRMLDLLSYMDLNSRILKSECLDSLENIDFRKVEKKIEEKRETSLKYLERIIETNE